MSQDENENSNVKFLITLIVLVFFGLIIVVSLLLPKETTQFFLRTNTLLNDFFNKPIFAILRTISGVIVVCLAGFATWLFFRLLEIEKEHEEHVYHHAHHDHESTEHQAHSVITEHTEKHVETNHDLLQKEDSTLHTRQSTQKLIKSTQERKEGESSVRGMAFGEERPGHFQWQSVLRLATSSNPSDWKLAIIEADVILDMMTYMQGIPGATLGERLKNADPGTFKTLKYAWGGHTMRNRIAHESNLELTPRDVNQTVRLYEAVFNEFKYI